jgi:RNA polymerase sigma-70 factor (ECF subfamily)
MNEHAPPAHDDDAALLHAWARGDRDAGSRIVERHYDAIVRFFRNKAGEEADDLVQRTFIATAEGAGRFQGRSSVRAWIFGIARNVLYEHLRRRVKDGRSEPEFRESALVDLAPGVSTVAARRADQRVLLHALQRIPIELQVLLELYYWENLGVEELAQALEVPAGTIKSRLHRARALLREATAKVPATPQETQSARILLDEWAQRVAGRAADGPE